MSPSDEPRTGFRKNFRAWWESQAWSWRRDRLLYSGLLISLVLFVFFVAFDLRDPEYFRLDFQAEQGMKERAESLLLVLALTEALVIARMLGRRLTLDGETSFSYLVFFGLIFILFLEDTDWLHIYLHYDIPQFVLKYNHAGECNLHNMDLRLVGILEKLYGLVVALLFISRGWHSLKGKRCKWPFELLLFFLIAVSSDTLHNQLRYVSDLVGTVHSDLDVDDTPHMFFIHIGVNVVLLSRLLVLLRFRYFRDRFQSDEEPYQVSPHHKHRRRFAARFGPDSAVDR
ncbi:hypothetical protein ACFL4G_04845 [Thermodesulfobacteriota bacterium]